MKKILTYQLGDLLAALYDEFSSAYSDNRMARVATTAAMNDLLIQSRELQKKLERRRKTQRRSDEATTPLRQVITNAA